jgi:hypothetical protein
MELARWATPVGAGLSQIFATEPVCSIQTCPARAIAGEDVLQWVQEKLALAEAIGGAGFGGGFRKNWPWLRRSAGRILAVDSFR